MSDTTVIPVDCERDGPTDHNFRAALAGAVPCPQATVADLSCGSFASKGELIRALENLPRVANSTAELLSILRRLGGTNTCLWPDPRAVLR